MAAGCGGGGEVNTTPPAAVEPTPNSLSLTFLGRYAPPTPGVGGAEIPAWDATTRRLFVVNGAAGSVDVLSLSNPAAPQKIGEIPAATLGGPVNSVSAFGGIVALAVEAPVKTDNGTVQLFNAANLQRIGNPIPVGALPDMLTFSPDGKTILVANEGEPNDAYTIDPEGSISIIDVSNPFTPTVRTADFRAFNARAAELRTAGVRIFGPNATVAQDLEPEYITVSADGRTAWVTLQENNALALVDIPSATVGQIVPLGYKNHALAGNGIDASDRDSRINIQQWPVFGMYQPDAIASFVVGGETFLITANEGDARAYTGFNEEVRASTLTFAPSLLNNPLCGGPCNTADRLGRLQVTNTLGRNATTGQYEALYAFGARSFSVWSATGQQVYDSGDELERRTAALFPTNFNASNDNNTFDDRSDNKGPEPEGVIVARFGTKNYAFIGLERIGGVMVYDLSNPRAPAFVTYINTRDFTQPVTSPASGDRGPEGLTIIPASSSPTGTPLLVVANETSGTTAVFRINFL
ncbi:alkaline phosphatase [beta proteobacterium AAP99]|nr:alkaline phosphatase [beta proteobacterium AAP99]